MANDINSLLSTTPSVVTQSAEQASALNSLANNFDNFLTILTTQLQNQDPLSPMESSEFTNQLVMFADVEQSVRQSGQLEDLIALNRQSEASTAVGYMGRLIQADYNEINYTGEPANITYNLPQEAAGAAIEIYDASGELVRLITGIPKEFGEHTVTWDGLDQFGSDLPNGAYSFQVGAHNKDQDIIQPTYKSEGIVTGVEFENGLTTLLMGDVRIPLGKVLRVENPPAAVEA